MPISCVIATATQKFTFYAVIHKVIANLSGLEGQMEPNNLSKTTGQKGNLLQAHGLYVQ